ncbi:hypothetical protein NMY22_g9211 [Coprinellus aureogranulatus]|nr:hypothetical protein NMY22_g9211 [Coprinellus aureogranulatus]
MDYTDLVFLGERETQYRAPPRDIECWIAFLLQLPSPIPYICSAIQGFVDLCDRARCSWNLENDAADFTDLVFFGDRPLWVPIPGSDTGYKSDIILIECQCCFTEHNAKSCVSCPADHSFCVQCLSKHASTLFGNGDPDLLCMDTSGCNLPFHPSVQDRMLSPKLIALRDRLILRRELKAANLDCFEECPFCDWGCIIEIPVHREPLFHCRNAENGCGVVSCRKCRKKAHGTKLCEEDEGLKEERLVVEEAMSKALVRNCPKCGNAFVKTGGCNKMTCPSCGTASCYLCRQIITDGYKHFSQSGPAQEAPAIGILTIVLTVGGEGDPPKWG